MSQFRFIAFLISALVMLSGAETDRSGGTLPLRGGGTLPLRMPADGTLPLQMTGDASAPVNPGINPDVAMSVDIELAQKPEPAALVTAPAGESACVQLFGPVWEHANGSGILVVGDEELQISDVCSHTITGEIALVASRVESDRTVSCFMTSLTTTEDLTAVNGELSCSEAVAGLKDLTFSLSTQN
jgi:hypothetical protein